MQHAWLRVGLVLSLAAGSAMAQSNPETQELRRKSTRCAPTTKGASRRSSSG